MYFSALTIANRCSLVGPHAIVNIIHLSGPNCGPYFQSDFNTEHYVKYCLYYDMLWKINTTVTIEINDFSCARSIRWCGSSKLPKGTIFQKELLFGIGR